ncbi:GNAT family N-acetyltransferase [Amycolatopsis methanolica]|uniref:Putative N-acetyltransferase n=1 Tax=Amycolatopsis methanolica 239 TaxID=1068978 RepID=A0A076MT62_AMYME|nr:GNAT family N-acetyltransferase [Amycolatopsis methanolica]AIJ22096.1 putative N-acetyltransferase [Amycolatopsis methanolica 239]
MLADHFPLLALRVRTPRLELRLPAPEELAALAELAAEGVNDPGSMPFLVPWTDQEPALVARSLVQFHWLRLGRWSPDDWGLDLVVFRDGEVLGQQSVSAKRFAITREVHTGSWVGRRHQGQGIGTEMRRAVLHLAFAGLGAEEAVSGASRTTPPPSRSPASSATGPTASRGTWSATRSPSSTGCASAATRGATRSR